MKRKKILLATGFVGGRGSSKAIRWAYDGFKERGFEPIIASESMYLYKLQNLNLKPDYVVNRSPQNSDESIYKKTADVLKKIDFDYLLAFQPRTYFSYFALQNKKPYTIVEYSVPEIFDRYPSPRIGQVYEQANLYLCLCPFPYDTPIPKNMTNVVICSQPYPQSRLNYADQVKLLTQNQAREKLCRYYPELRKYRYDRLVFLNINDEYINPFNISPNNLGFSDQYGIQQNGYLRLNDFDQTIGFVNRLIAGLETNFSGRTLVYMLEKVKEFVAPVLKRCKKVTAFSRPAPFVDLETDLLLKQAADINLCRAALCDNQCDLYLLNKPCVTSVVPLNFMNEDKAILVAKKRKTTYLIPYNDPDYIKKLAKFVDGKKTQKIISANMDRSFKTMWQKYNFYDFVLADINKPS